MPRTKYYHADEVAEILGVSVAEVYKMLASGELNGHKNKRHWLIDMDQFEDEVGEGARYEDISFSLFTEDEPDDEFEYYTQYIKDEEHEDVIYDCLMDATESIYISSADFKNLFIHKRSILDILDDKVGEGVEVKIICSNPKNIVIDNMQEYENLIDTDLFMYRECIRNHMKVSIFDKEIVYVGSANLTNAAMGGKSDKKRNFEAGILSNEPSLVDVAVGHFEEVWSDDNCKSCRSKLCEFAK